MSRGFTSVALFISLVLALTGCMVQQSTYQKKAEEADRLGNEVIALQQRNKALAEENELLRQQVQNRSEEKKQAGVTAEAGAQAGPPEKEEPKVEEEKITEPPKEKAAASPEVTAAPKPPEKKAADVKSMRLKVLSGNGKMSSAKRMSAKLTKLGYRVEVVGMATTPDYVTDTIYYKSGFEKQAAGMAKKLGGKSIAKPLTWSSVFDIIVVVVR